MQIRIGVPVIAEDGDAGKVERLIIHPGSGDLHGVVAVQGGMLTRDVVIPADRILAADADGVRVRGTAEQISELEQFAQSQYVEPPENWIPPVNTLPEAALYLFPTSPLAVGAFAPPSAQPPPVNEEVEILGAGDVALDARTPVRCRDGEAGHVARVLTQEHTGHVTHVVVTIGSLVFRDVMVPVNQVRHIDDEAVDLDLSLEELAHLPTA